jgi:heat shock protein HtpX
MLKRIFLFLATNILIVTTISILLNVLGVRPYLTSSGIDYEALLAFCLVWGFAGSFISLAISRIMAKWMMGVKVITPSSHPELAWLHTMVERIAQTSGLPTPEVGVYDSPEINAFATGPTKSRALVAFSSGIIQSMDRTELEGVAAHEVAHIRNGDMVTMTLLQGVVNSFVMFLARVIGFAASQAVKEEQAALVRMLVTIVLDILLSILGSMVVMAFSRKREFHADAGAAKLVGREKMIRALEFLKRTQEYAQVGEPHASLATMKISGKRMGALALFSSHPALEDRIEALKNFRE